MGPNPGPIPSFTGECPAHSGIHFHPSDFDVSDHFLFLNIIKEPACHTSILNNGNAPFFKVKVYEGSALHAVHVL